MVPACTGLRAFILVYSLFLSLLPPIPSLLCGRCCPSSSIHFVTPRPETLGNLLDYMFADHAPALASGMQLLQTLINEAERGEDEAAPTPLDRERHHVEVQKVLSVIGPRLGRLHDLLLAVPPALQTASGMVKTPLGASRLKVEILSENAWKQGYMLWLTTLVCGHHPGYPCYICIDFEQRYGRKQVAERAGLTQRPSGTSV